MLKYCIVVTSLFVLLEPETLVSKCRINGNTMCSTCVVSTEGVFFKKKKWKKPVKVASQIRLIEHQIVGTMTLKYRTVVTFQCT